MKKIFITLMITSLLCLNVAYADSVHPISSKIHEMSYSVGTKVTIGEEEHEIIEAHGSWILIDTESIDTSLPLKISLEDGDYEIYLTSHGHGNQNGVGETEYWVESINKIITDIDEPIIEEPIEDTPIEEPEDAVTEEEELVIEEPEEEVIIDTPIEEIPVTPYVPPIIPYIPPIIEEPTDEDEPVIENEPIEDNPIIGEETDIVEEEIPENDSPIIEEIVDDENESFESNDIEDEIIIGGIEEDEETFFSDNSNNEDKISLVPKTGDDDSIFTIIASILFRILAALNLI